MKFAISIAALAAVCVSNAAIIYDNTAVTDGSTFRSGDTPAISITNTNAFDVTVDGVAFLGTPQVDHNTLFTFFLADSSGNILDTQDKLIVGTGHHLYGTTVNNWMLQAGKSYFIGATFDSGNQSFDYRLSWPTQNGLSTDVNGNFVNGTFAFEGTAGANMDWVISGNAVPEPASMAALGLGVAALIRRRRASK